MFERYTEKARRVIFFARYEASQVGNPYIESEHLLIGLLRESGHELRRYLGSRVSAEELRAEIAASTLRREPTSTSVDLPLTNECKRILAYAAEEAARLVHQHIGTEHLLLGILREEGCLAARLLSERGMELEATRKAVEAAAKEVSVGSGTGRPQTSPTRWRFQSFRIVDDTTAEELLLCPEVPSVPRIGDAVLIGKEGSPGQSYRVKDVVWDFILDVHGSRLRDLVVKVVKDNAVSGDEGSSQ